MNGLSWLGGKKWSQVTRDERFFCAHLYKKVMEQNGGVARFVSYINECCGLALPAGENWELGYEVVFYRDMWFENAEKFEMISGKRTFDLCLFSDERIVIIEAKAYQDFDKAQTEEFRKDKRYIAMEYQLPVEVLLVPLASSLYAERFRKSGLVGTFDTGKLLTWKFLSEKYDGDQILASADDVYARRPKAVGTNEGFVEGDKLIELYRSGQVDAKGFWVGRGQGVGGLQADLKNEEWRKRLYQTNASAPKPPNGNWFSLENFARTVTAASFPIV